MIKIIDIENCEFSFEGKEYRLPMTLKQVREQLTQGYVESPVHAQYSMMREKEEADVTDEEVEDYIMKHKSEWEEVYE